MCQYNYVQQKTEEYIRMMVDRGVIYFGVGGALGFDLLAAKLLFRLRDTDCQNIKVILVYPFEGYTNRWSDRLKEQHKLLLPLYDKTVCVSELCNKEAYLKRNRHLVDNSNYCICYWSRIGFLPYPQKVLLPMPILPIWRLRRLQKLLPTD